MASIKVSGEQPFQIPGASRFCIGQTEAGYTLNFSADGVNWTPWTDGTLAETDQVVVNAAEGMYFKLAGNTSEDVVITW